MKGITHKLLAFAVTLTAGTACADLLDPAAAVVDGHKIPFEDVQSVLDDFASSEAYNERAQQGEGQIVKREFERSYLSQLIRRAVLEPRAAELGIVVTDPEVGERIEQIKADFPTEKAFRETLKEQGLTMELLEGLVRDRALEDELRAEVTAGARPSEEDLVDYYDKHLDDYKETRASHILVDDKKPAQKIIAQLDLALQDKVDDLFARLATQHSTDQGSAVNGGDLGWSAPGQFVEAFDAAMQRLKSGEFSDPVRTEFGWHVIFVRDRRTKTFAQVRDEIEQQLATPLQDEAWERWLVTAYESAGVEVNPRYGVFDVATQQVVDPRAADVPGAEEPRDETPAPLPTG